MCNSTSNSQFPQDQPQTRRCCKGDLCLNSAGPNADLPFSEFSKNSSSKDGYSYSCVACVKFERYWRKHFKTDSRDIALEKFNLHIQEITHEKKPGLKRCAHGDLCVDQNGPYLPVDSFSPGKNKDGLYSVCKSCHRFLSYWCRMLTGMDRNQALAIYMKVRADLDYEPPVGYQRCSKKDRCVSLDGPLQLEDRFNNKVGQCKDCANFPSWLKNRGIVDPNPENIAEYQAFLLSKILPDGYRRCSCGDDCVSREGQIQTSDNFRLTVSKGKTYLSDKCVTCEMYRSWKRRNGKNLGKEEFYLLKFPPEGYYTCSSLSDCCNPNGPVLLKSEFKKTLSGWMITNLKCNDCRSALLVIRLNLLRASGKFTKADRKLVLDWFENKCVYCGIELIQGNRALDHFIPVTKNGRTSLDNILPSCKSCNSSKLASDPISWVLSKFGEDQGQLILARIQEFFDTVRIVEQGNN